MKNHNTVKLLKDNIIGVFAPYKEDVKKYILFDASSEPNGLKKIRYAKDEDIHVNRDMDLSKYEVFFFKMYTEDKAAIGKEFRLSFACPATVEHPCNFYQRPLIIKNTGWNYFSGKLINIDRRNYPSWDNIVQFNIHHNDKKCDEDITLYFDSVVLYEKEEGCYWGNHLAVLKDAVGFSVGGPRAIYNDRQYEIDKGNSKAKVFQKDGTYWLPLSVFAAYNDSEATYDTENKTLTMKYLGKLCVFTPNENVVEANGTLFVPHTYAMEIFGFPHVYTDKFGIIILSKEKIEYDMVKDLGTLLDISFTTLFERPSGEKMVEDIIRHTGNINTHPKLFLSEEDIERLREYYKNDSKYRAYYDELLDIYGKDSKEFNSAPISHATMKEQTFHSSVLLGRVASWAMFYKISGDEDYAKRIWEEMENLCDYPDWISHHYLTTSEICVSAAMVYDWLYDYLTEEQRQKLANAIIEKCLKIGLDHYEGRRIIWPPTNWNGICNAGTCIGAIALLDVCPELSTKILGYGILNVEESLDSFAPDASHLESVMYWEFHVKYYHMYLAALDSACGTQYGLYNAPGFADSAYFAYFMQTEIGSWPYHDSLGDIVINNYLYWFAVKQNDTFLAEKRHEQIERAKKVRRNPPAKPADDIGLAVSFFDLMWYRPIEKKSDNKVLPLDAYYRKIDIVTMRSGWERGAIFTGLHGGENNASHGDLDTGNFILYAKGHKFFDDLGKENYKVPGYFDYPPTVRWHYYRKRAEGHNTIVVGKSDFNVPDQAKYADSKFTCVELSNASSKAVLDMKEAYSRYEPVKFRRGMFFTNNKSVIILQDEIVLKKEETICWSAHTRSSFETKIYSKGRVAVIDAGDCALYCELVSNDESLKFELCAAESFDSNYKNHEIEFSRDEYRKLLVKTSKPVRELNMAVVFTIMGKNSKMTEQGCLYTFENMDYWKI